MIPFHHRHSAHRTFLMSCEVAASVRVRIAASSHRRYAMGSNFCPASRQTERGLSVERALRWCSLRVVFHTYSSLPMISFVPVRRSVSALARATAAVVLALGCQGDLATDPIGQPRLTPTEALPALTGGVGTEIFPTAPAGEEQPSGDARGLNASGQVTGGAFNLPLSASDGADAYRWTPGGSAVRIIGVLRLARRQRHQRRRYRRRSHPDRRE